MCYGKEFSDAPEIRQNAVGRVLIVWRQFSDIKTFHPTQNVLSRTITNQFRDSLSVIVIEHKPGPTATSR